MSGQARLVIVLEPSEVYLLRLSDRELRHQFTRHTSFLRQLTLIP